MEKSKGRKNADLLKTKEQKMEKAYNHKQRILQDQQKKILQKNNLPETQISEKSLRQKCLF